MQHQEPPEPRAGVDRRTNGTQGSAGNVQAGNPGTQGADRKSGVNAGQAGTPSL